MILTAGVDYGTVEVEGELSGVTIVGDGDTDVKFNILSTASLTNVTFTGFSVEYTDNTGAYVDGGIINIDAGATVPAELTITDCKFTNCTGGIAKYLGSAVPGGKFVFTNNTLTNCAGHDGSDAKWFALPYATADITISGNTLNGVAWNPGVAQGLGK